MMLLITTMQKFSFSIQVWHSLTLSDLFSLFYLLFISLKKSGEKGPFWICSFAMYQSDGDGDSPTIVEQMGFSLQFSPYSNAFLKGAEYMVVVITGLCDIYTRLWYVWLSQIILIQLHCCKFHFDCYF